MDPLQQWFSIQDLRSRWSCSKTYVYRALREMDRDGYLEQLFLNSRNQRIALQTVLRWEREHSQPIEHSRSEIVALREQDTAFKKEAPPASAKPLSLLEEWKRRKEERRRRTAKLPET